MRLRFKDSEILEGLMPADLTQTTPEGFLVNPPDQRVEHAADFRAANCAGVADGAGGDWRHAAPAARNRRSAAGSDV